MIRKIKIPMAIVGIPLIAIAPRLIDACEHGHYPMPNRCDDLSDLPEIFSLATTGNVTFSSTHSVTYTLPT